MDIQIDRTAFENCFSVFTKVNIHIPHDLADPLLLIPPTDAFTKWAHRDPRDRTIHQQRREIIVASSSHRMLSSSKKESPATTYKNTDIAPKHTKEKKPETKGYIMHDPINRRLANRPKKALNYSVSSRGVMLSVGAGNQGFPGLATLFLNLSADYTGVFTL